MLRKFSAQSHNWLTFFLLTKRTGSYILPCGTPYLISDILDFKNQTVLSDRSFLGSISYIWCEPIKCTSPNSTVKGSLFKLSNAFDRQKKQSQRYVSAIQELFKSCLCEGKYSGVSWSFLYTRVDFLLKDYNHSWIVSAVYT